MKHLYVHIPFCRTPCAYCDFASEPVGPHARAGRVERYLEALRDELIERAGGGTGPSSSFQTIYLGGGTPTVLAPDLLVALTGYLAAWLEKADGTAEPAVEPDAPDAGLSAAAVGDTSDAADTGLGAMGRVSASPGAVPRAAAEVALDPVLCTVARPEFTIEANPGTIDAALLERLVEAGVTRISLGVQSFSPALRATLGRRVSQKEIEDALDILGALSRPVATGAGPAGGAGRDQASADHCSVATGGPPGGAGSLAVGGRSLTGTGRPPTGAGRLEWNLDLVFGIPGQTAADAFADVDAAVAAGPTHISLYDLTYTLAYQTRVDVTLGAGARSAAGAFAERYYAEVVARLEAAGYRRYEVSNFAPPGHECRHNLAYWRGEDYIGIGASAVSTLGGERRTNPRSVGEYLTGRPARIEMLSPETKMWEKAMLGLRTSDGVDEEAVLPVVDRVARDRLLAQGCLERRYGRIRLNPGVLDVSNTVIGTLLVPPGES
jgi:coproporphyrinogen III oxidase-like Fe-S oxidoreductase